MAIFPPHGMHRRADMENYNLDCRRRAAIQALASASVAKPGTSLLAHSGRDITTVYWPSFCILTM